MIKQGWYWKAEVAVSQDRIIALQPRQQNETLSQIKNKNKTNKEKEMKLRLKWSPLGLL